MVNDMSNPRERWSEYVVVFDSFTTGARKYLSSRETWVARRAEAATFTSADARTRATRLQAMLGRSVIVSTELKAKGR